MRTALRGIGQALITAGLVILLFCAYELWFTNIYTAHQQTQLLQDLTKEWRDPGPGTSAAAEIPEVKLGHGIAVVRIPRLGRNYHYVIVEGVGVDDLKKGPGHVPGTALPGQVGNFVVSGHRTTYKAPFNRLNEVRPGDSIVLETRNTWYTYRETQELVVQPSAVWVTAAFPTPPDAPPPTGITQAKRILTFTTCNPKYSARQRLILFGELESSMPKAAGLPPALQGSG